MVITDHDIAEFRIFKLIIRRIQANLTTSGFLLAKLMDFNLIARRILANLSTITNSGVLS